jgi:hypothetical protein
MRPTFWPRMNSGGTDSRRLAGMLPNARLVEIPDSHTLVPPDQPTALARALSVFLTATVPPTAGAR